ncbi:Malic enzyme, NAD-binding [Penicillium occitanis (nom. inval.)]|nr:Malic enzyme, NAD-binding [Penicillium occitanis (nom. inval.)]PCH08306.1 hypothetical protein PENOC_015160 [Penicillium occitanis (nom. inval.)]
MTYKYAHLPRSASKPLECGLEGHALLHDSYFNKGSAFPSQERHDFGLHGLLPPNIQTLDEQVERAYQQYSSQPDDLAKNTFMASMKAQNEVLYYRLISDHLKEMFSVIYTPTEGDAIQNYSRIFRKPEGCFLNIHDVDRIEHDLKQFTDNGTNEDVDYIVVTDGEEALAIKVEDFGLKNARRLLEKYRPQIACFNDDVQGTGCVTLAALMAGLHVSKVKLGDVRIVIFGSGTAGTGIADQIRDAIATESGKSKEEAAKHIWCIDKPGLLFKSHEDKLTPAQIPYAREDSEWEDHSQTDLHNVVKRVQPHALIGTSTKPKAFTEDVIREMAKHVDRPIVFPLSNPTRLHEAQPQDINEWTDGKALIATGSPFPPVEHNGVKKEIAECNNSTCFPGIGLGAVLSQSRLLSDKMLVAAVKALAAQSPALQDPNKPLLPDVEDVREISVHIAKAVIQAAVEEELAQEKGIPEDDQELEQWIREQMWDPVYRPLVKGRST